MNKLKDNRLISFILLLFVYVTCSILGVVIFKNLVYSFWIKLLISDVICTIYMFIFSLIFKNASVYDPYWSVQPIVIVTILFFTNPYSLTGLLALIAVLFWGIRLTLNWAYTFKNLNQQDWRYSLLKEKTGKLYPIVNFVGIHLVPTLVVYLCVLPVGYLFINETQFNPYSIIFFITAIIAVIIQGTADIQMHIFRKHNKGKLNRNGLWKYSRHPNYLGEIMMWWSMGLFSIMNNPDNIVLLIGALVNTCLFLFISIPLAEGHQASRKPGFSEYKKETRMLLPIKKPLF